jgi:hypothetical protein
MASPSPERIGLALPGSDGGVVVPWVALVIGRDGPLETLDAPPEVQPEPDGSFVLRAEGSSFDAVARWSAPDRAGGRDVELEIASRAGKSIDASIGVGLRLGGTPRPWILVPGLFYGENRPTASRRLYPRWALGAPDADAFTSDRWAFRSDRAALPLVLASDGSRTAALATTETSELGMTGLAFAADGRTTDVGLFAPYHEQPIAYDGSETPRPGFATFHRFEPGERRTLRYRVYTGPPDRYAFAPVVRDVHARLAAESPLRPWMDVESAAALAATGLLRWHHRPAEAVLLETVAFERPLGPPGGGASVDAPGDRPAMHVAWLSGIPTAYALLLHGRRAAASDAVDAATAVIDNVTANLAPAGTFWGQWTRSNGWGKGWTAGRDAVHARTLAEAALFLARALRLERGFGNAHPRWEAALRSNLAFVAARARDDGALGSAYDGRTGDVLSWDGTAGLAWAPALVEGARLLDEPGWLDLARSAGGHYAAAVDDASLGGAPEDVDLAPSSEDGYVAVIAYVALAEAADDPESRVRWLELARRAADWALTSRYAYDVAFEPTTLAGTYRYASRGADQASPANQHLHVYGLVCTPELVRLARALDDDWYAIRTAEHLAAARQFLARTDADFNARVGMAPERVYQTACFGPKGAIGPLSHAWVLGLTLYAAEVALDLPELADPALDGGIASADRMAARLAAAVTGGPRAR